MADGMVRGGRWYGERDPANEKSWPYATSHHDPQTAAVCAVLEDWFWAMEDGLADLRLPDPAYVRPGGKPPWTGEDVDRIIAAIDEEYGKEFATSGAWARIAGCNAGPGFERLAPAQRLALVQQLATALAAPRQEPKPEPESKPGPGEAIMYG